MDQSISPPVSQKPARYYIGWVLILASVAQLPVFVAGVKVLFLAPKIGGLLMAFTAPSLLGLFIAGLGLVWGKTFGYYFAYASVFFGGIGGLKAPFLPTLKRIVPAGPNAPDIFLLLNLALVAFLIWDQFRHVGEADERWQKIHRLGVSLMVALGLCWIGGERLLTEKKGGQAQTSRDLPHLGAALAGFKPSGPLQFSSVWTQYQNGIALAIGGKASEASLLEFVAEQKLNKFSVEQREKFLPWVKNMKLDKELFPLDFGEEDRYFSGRLSGEGKVNFQICWRKSDSRFTAQAFGVMK